MTEDRMHSNPQEIDVRTFRDFKALRELELADIGETSGSIFQTVAWFENLLHTSYDPDAKTFLVLGRDKASRAYACLPLVGNQYKMTSLGNYYSCLFGPLNGSADPSGKLWPAICRHVREQGGRPGVVELHPLDPAAPFFTDMMAALRRAGYWPDSYFCFGNWYLKVADRSFKDYFAGLASRVRGNVLRGRRKLDGAGPWAVQIQQHADAALDGAIADFRAVYARSWKQAEPHPEFIGGLCRMAAAHGWLRLGILRLNGYPIAAQLWLLKDRTALIYKLAYDESRSRFSPGSILTAALLEHVIEVDKVEEVDYLSGDDGYKRDWMSDRRERRGIVAFDPLTPTGLIAALRHFGGKRIRKLLPDGNRT